MSRFCSDGRQRLCLFCDTVAPGVWSISGWPGQSEVLAPKWPTRLLVPGTLPGKGLEVDGEVCIVSSPLEETEQSAGCFLNIQGLAKHTSNICQEGCSVITESSLLFPQCGGPGIFLSSEHGHE